MNTGTHRAAGVALALGWALYAPWDGWRWSVFGVLAGSNAPDWLELPARPFGLNIRLSAVPHRTITHWVLPWAVAVWLLWPGVEMGDKAASGLAGFCCSAMLHIVMDFLTPMGVPVLVPWKRWHL